MIKEFELPFDLQGPKMIIYKDKTEITSFLIRVDVLHVCWVFSVFFDGSYVFSLPWAINIWAVDGLNRLGLLKML